MRNSIAVAWEPEFPRCIVWLQAQQSPQCPSGTPPLSLHRPPFPPYTTPPYPSTMAKGFLPFRPHRPRPSAPRALHTATSSSPPCSAYYTPIRTLFLSPFCTSPIPAPQMAVPQVAALHQEGPQSPTQKRRDQMPPPWIDPGCPVATGHYPLVEAMLPGVSNRKHATGTKEEKHGNLA